MLCLYISKHHPIISGCVSNVWWCSMVSLSPAQAILPCHPQVPGASSMFVATNHRCSAMWCRGCFFTPTWSMVLSNELIRAHQFSSNISFFSSATLVSSIDSIIYVCKSHQIIKVPDSPAGPVSCLNKHVRGTTWHYIWFPPEKWWEMATTGPGNKRVTRLGSFLIEAFNLARQKENRLSLFEGPRPAIFGMESNKISQNMSKPSFWCLKSLHLLMGPIMFLGGAYPIKRKPNSWCFKSTCNFPHIVVARMPPKFYPHGFVVYPSLVLPI